jgi:hypothetical protein
VNKVKEECEGVTWGLMSELEKCFPEHEVMIVLGVIYPQFWTRNIVKVETIFHSHMNALKAIFCVPHKLGENGRVRIRALLSTHDLDCSRPTSK